MKKILAKIGKEYWCSVLMTAALFFMLCIYEPLTIFFQNKDEYLCDFWVLLPECLRLFAVLFGAVSLALLVVRLILRKRFIYVVALLFWGYVCLYIQGNYMVSDLPVLDGRYIYWSEYRGDIIFSTVFWIVMLAATFILLHFLKRDRFRLVSQGVCVFVSLVLLVTGVTVGISNDGFEKRIELAVSYKNILDYSSDTNVIILVLDAMDAVVENEVLEEYPEYAEAFHDFTYYDNVTSKYIITEYALPFLVGGHEYVEEEGPQVFYYSNTYDSDLVSTLTDLDYRMTFYASTIALNTERAKMFENIVDYKAEVDDHTAFCKVLLRTTGFKYAPYLLKTYTQVLPDELNSYLKKPEDVELLDFYHSDRWFAVERNPEAYTLSEDKCFKLIHLNGAHYPFELTRDLDYVLYSSYEECMAASNTLMEMYFEKLQEEGIYDNSIIIVTADHGISPDNDLFKRTNPILFVKGLNEHHDTMQRSSAPAAHEDFSEMYSRLLNGAMSDEVFDWEEGDYRERTIHIGESLSSMETYIQTGQARDKSTMIHVEE